MFSPSCSFNVGTTIRTNFDDSIFNIVLGNNDIVAQYHWSFCAGFMLPVGPLITPVGTNLDVKLKVSRLQRIESLGAANVTQGSENRTFKSPSFPFSPHSSADLSKLDVAWVLFIQLLLHEHVVL